MEDRQSALVHELFEEQVRRTRQAVAVACEGESLTYDELNSRANQLARYLRERGVGPDQLVGICVERGLEMVVGLLGILKAGGAYVPLDPNYPPERLAHMLNDTGLKLLVTQERLRNKVPQSDAEVVTLDGHWGEVTQRPAGDLDSKALGQQSHHLAYVIYTSGSTGKPKGVMVEHRGLCNTALAQASHIPLEPGRRVLQAASLSFDACVFEMVLTLCQGATLHVAEPGALLAGSTLTQILQERAITDAVLTPAVVSGLDDNVDLSSIRTLIVAGEAVTAALVQRWARGRRFINAYGPTEASIWATSYDCDPAESVNPPIGRPISNAQIHILDEQLQPVPNGVAGEIYIGGQGVARGYWNRPELTAERFIADPFTSKASARLYKSGDLGRRRSDGVIEYVGRNDDQVKIRGFRIELGEIEAELRRHDQVKEAVVILHEGVPHADVPTHKRLVAYVIPKDSAESTRIAVDTLRTHLTRSLPEYMIPSAFVVLDKLPLTPNGKLDKQALPVPALTAYVSRPYEAPQDELELLLTEIWQDLLRVERVGRQDHFFELGGHSLLIVQSLERLGRVGLSAPAYSLYEHPTLLEFARTVRSKGADNFEMPLVELQPEHLERIAQAVPGGKDNIKDIYPLAPLQEGILFHHMLDKRGGDPHVIPTLLSLSSRAKVDGLVAALQQVINRHDILRTAILWQELPQPLQIVYREATLPVDEIVLAQDRDPIEQMMERMNPELQNLDLRRAPLMQLLVAADTRHGHWYALLRFHHLTTDHESIQTMLAEVKECLHGRAESLAASAPYRNHIAQVLSLTRAQEVAVETFFRSKLKSIDEPTAPFGLTDVHGAGNRIELAFQPLEPELSSRIRTEARRIGVSAATLFHAAWALVVARTSNRHEVVYGTVLLGRMQASTGSQPALGMFINTLPLRIQLQGITARELVEQTRRELVELLNHEQTSLSVAQRCSGIAGSTPLFSALLNYRHTTLPVETAQPYLAEGVQVIACRSLSSYPVSLAVDDLSDGSFALTAQTDRRVDPHRVLGYAAAAMQSLLQALEAAPEKEALELSILPQSERQQLLQLFNATAGDSPQDKLIHQLFEEQVSRTPHRAAVVYEDRSLTYAELNRKANQLARYLSRRGVGPGQLVGLCAERGLEIVVGLLGILKAGAAYVPLDSSYPAERLAYMLRDSDPIVVLTQERLRGALPSGATPVITLEAKDIAQEFDGNLEPTELGVKPHNLAYVIYTSGSTGAPKGVMVTHRNLVASTSARWHAYGELGRFLLLSPVGFDSSVAGIFGSLTHQGTLLIATQAMIRDPHRLSVAIGELRATSLLCVPSLYRAILDAPGFAEASRTLTRVIVAGEACPPTLVAESARRVPQVTLFNEYGPTEATVWASVFECSGAESLSTVPIGRPIANTQIYILDDSRQVAPVGVTGELYIGGAGVTRGYLNRPDLTAERFITDPFSADPQARLYKTGDLGRWKADGNIEYAGRNDHQVKVRGFRIELGEIEAQLAQHAQVKEAVVIARDDAPGEKRLVAYVVPQQAPDAAEAPTAEALRTHLKSALPEHMVPTAFVVLDAFPLTPNGKLDRKALPAPELAAYASRAYEPPETEVEVILAGIWQELLQVERVGRRDNFFELGGHSLLIVQVMEKLRLFGLSAAMHRVFETPVLADLASLLQQGETSEVEIPPNGIPPDSQVITPQMLPLVELEPHHIELIVQSVPGGAANIEDIYPLAPLQEGFLFHHLLDENGGDIYVWPTVLSVASHERLQELIAALQAVIDRHPVVRTAVHWDQLPRPVQVVHRQAILPVREVTLDPDHDPQEQIRDWARPERQRLDVRCAPLLNIQIAADPNSSQWYVLLQLHQLTVDHISAELAIAEAVAHLEKLEPRLPQFVPYRNHVAQAIAPARTQDAETFFRKKLHDVDEPTAPFGLLDVRGDGSRIEQGHLSLESDLARRIRAQGRKLGISSAILFHAAWALVVARTSGREDVVFGTVLSGRLQGRAGAQWTMGLFINTLPLRIRLRDVSSRELLDQTQREMVELLRHEQASLAVAQRCSGIVGSAPLFTVLLNYRHSAPNPDAHWDRAAGIEVLVDEERSNYPMVLSVDDLGDGFKLTAQTDRLLDPHRILRYMETALQSLLEALENRPQQPALNLVVLPASERQQVLELFNAAQTVHPRADLIHELFEAQVQQTRQAVAVVCEGESLTYAQLNGRANQLARYLIERGVKRDQLVGISVSRGLEMVVGLLGILKAGAAYVPLDPNYPPERLAYMLSDTGLKLLLTQMHSRDKVSQFGAEVVTLDGDWAEVTQHPEDNLDSKALGQSRHQLAYVIYTSGSTGRPKGVMVEHGGLCNTALALARFIPLEPGRHVLQAASLSFDASALEMVLTLCQGATLHMADPDAILVGSTLTQILQERAITDVFLTPSVVSGLDDNVDLSSIRTLIMGAEAVAAAHVKRWGVERRLINAYGPTESSILATLYECDPEELVNPPIGRPIANALIYILDDLREPVPLGVAGEIYIGGKGVARGYWNRPELTAERFVADPFSSEPSARLYKSGDLGRWRADGTIEYLGRNDHQVKIRGFRIELGEIGAELTRHEAVKEAVVIARDDVPGERRLVAYLVAEEGDAAPGVEALRTHLQAVLPEHMIPSAFVTLEQLPLTANGKLDRKALPEPELDAYLTREYEAPRGKVEEFLAGLWQKLLRLERVGRHDNFFEMGGQSLLAIQAVTRIRATVLKDMSTRMLFDFPSVAALAAEVHRRQEARLRDRLAAGGHDVRKVLEKLSAMSEGEAQRLIRERRAGART